MRSLIQQQPAAADLETHAAPDTTQPSATYYAPDGKEKAATPRDYRG